jgi:hypothetical protein
MPFLSWILSFNSQTGQLISKTKVIVFLLFNQFALWLLKQDYTYPVRVRTINCTATSFGFL